MCPFKPQERFFTRLKISSILGVCDSSSSPSLFVFGRVLLKGDSSGVRGVDRCESYWHF